MNSERGNFSTNKKLVGLGLLSLLCLAFVGDCWAHKVEVQVLTYSEVPANMPVRLGFIAAPLVDVDGKFESIQDVEVFASRAAGERQFLGRIEIARALQDAVSSEEFTFKIPNQMILQSKKNLIAQIDVERSIVREIEKQCGECRIHLRDVKVPELKEVNEDLTSWAIDFSQTKLLGNFLVPVKVQFASGVKSIFVSGAADVFKDGLVTRRAISPGERLNEVDFEKKNINVTFLKGSLLAANEVKGQLAAHHVASGQVLISGDIKREPAANRGQLMKVVAGDETLEITLQAVAEEAGYIGDLIKLKNTETQKMISGRILEKGVVKLQ